MPLPLWHIIVIAIMARQIKRKRKGIDSKTKVIILRDVEDIEKRSFGCPNKGDITKKYQIKPSTLSSIIKTKENVFKAAESDTRLKFKYSRSTKA